MGEKIKDFCFPTNRSIIIIVGYNLKTIEIGIDDIANKFIPYGFFLSKIEEKISKNDQILLGLYQKMYAIYNKSDSNLTK
jgi:hypothetical protein